MENKTANKKGGLYARVNMSVKSANIMVGALVAALIIVSVFIIKHNGFTVKFDTDGGSYVAPVKAMYSETVSPADPDTPLEETMGALTRAVRSGKALYAGLSNYNGEQLEKAVKILTELKCPFIINQNRYSIFDRTIEQNGLKSTAVRLEKGIIAFSPLAQGMLTDRYLNGIPADSRIMTDGRFLKQSAVTPERLEQIRKLNEIAKERGQTLAEMALAWVLKDGVVTSVLIGASKPSQILDNIKAINNTAFSAEELEKINKVCNIGGNA